MRKKIKKYYDNDFGDFVQVFADEIAERCMQEFQKLQLPPLLFLKEGWTTPNRADVVNPYTLVEALNRLLVFTVN